MKIYLELVEKSADDDFENRIANQKSDVIIEDDDTGDEEESIKFLLPEELPTFITEDPVIFSPIVIKKDGTQDTTKTVKLDCVLENLPAGVSIDQYINISEKDGVITITRLRKYSRGNLILNWSICENGEVIKENVFSFSVRLQG